MVSFSESDTTNSLNLYGSFLHTQNMPASQTEQGDLVVFTAAEEKRERKAKGSQMGEDNNSEPARIVLRGLFPS